MGIIIKSFRIDRITVLLFLLGLYTLDFVVQLNNLDKQTTQLRTLFYQSADSANLVRTIR